MELAYDDGIAGTGGILLELIPVFKLELSPCEFSPCEKEG